MAFGGYPYIPMKDVPFKHIFVPPRFCTMFFFSVSWLAPGENPPSSSEKERETMGTNGIFCSPARSHDHWISLMCFAWDMAPEYVLNQIFVILYRYWTNNILCPHQTNTWDVFFLPDFFGISVGRMLSWLVQMGSCFSAPELHLLLQKSRQHGVNLKFSEKKCHQN